MGPTADFDGAAIPHPIFLMKPTYIRIAKYHDDDRTETKGYSNTKRIDYRIYGQYPVYIQEQLGTRERKNSTKTAMHCFIDLISCVYRLPVLQFI